MASVMDARLAAAIADFGVDVGSVTTGQAIDGID